MEDLFGGCQIDVGSLTLALKAQRALGNAAIPSAVAKNDSSSKGGRGCSYGLRLSCSQMANAERVIAHEGIRVKRWIHGSDKI